MVKKQVFLCALCSLLVGTHDGAPKVGKNVTAVNISGNTGAYGVFGSGVRFGHVHYHLPQLLLPVILRVRAGHDHCHHPQGNLQSEYTIVLVFRLSGRMFVVQ